MEERRTWKWRVVMAVVGLALIASAVVTMPNRGPPVSRANEDIQVWDYEQNCWAKDGRCVPDTYSDPGLYCLDNPDDPTCVDGTRSTDLAWDCVYDVDWVFPENGKCPWPLTSDGTASRAIQDAGDVLNYTLAPGASGDIYERVDPFNALNTSALQYMTEIRFRITRTGAAAIGPVLEYDLIGTYGIDWFETIEVDVNATNVNLAFRNDCIFFSRIGGYNGLSYGTYYTVRMEMLAPGVLDNNKDDVAIRYYLDGVMIDQFWCGRIQDGGGLPFPAATKLDVRFLGPGGATFYAEVDYCAYKKALDRDPSDVDPTPLPIIREPRPAKVNTGTRGTDPYHVFVYDISNTDAASPAAFNQVYRLGEADYTVERDDLFLTKSDANTIYINDTKSTSSTSDDTVLLTTTAALTYVNVLTLSATTDGENVTVVKPAGSTIRSDRDSTVRVRTSFVWTNTDPTRRLWTFSLTYANNLTRDWRNFWTFVPFEPTVTADLSTVQVFDVANNQLLVKGQHYTLDSGGVSFGLDTLSSGQSRAFTVAFNEFQEGTQILEPQCNINGRPTTGTYAGREYNLATFTCTNANGFQYSGRVVLFFSGVSDPVDVTSVVMSDSTGRTFTQVTPLGGNTVAVYGITMNAFSSQAFNVYFLYEPDPFTPNWFRLGAPWIAVACVLAMAISANRVLKVKEERQLYVAKFALGMSGLLLAAVVVLGFVL